MKTYEENFHTESHLTIFNISVIPLLISCAVQSSILDVRPLNDS